MRHAQAKPMAAEMPNTCGQCRHSRRLIAAGTLLAGPGADRYGTAKMSAAVMTSVSGSARSTCSLPHTTYTLPT